MVVGGGTVVGIGTAFSQRSPSRPGLHVHVGRSVDLAPGLSVQVPPLMQ